MDTLQKKLKWNQGEFKIEKREEEDQVGKDKDPNDINATPSTRPRTIKITPITIRVIAIILTIRLIDGEWNNGVTQKSTIPITKHIIHSTIMILFDNIML